jgi:hypothetical protein
MGFEGSFEHRIGGPLGFFAAFREARETHDPDDTSANS